MFLSTMQPAREVVGGDDHGGDGEHAPVAVEGEEGERAERVEMGFDPAAGQVGNACGAGAGVAPGVSW